MELDRSYDRFTKEVEHLLNGTAESKGYNKSGPDGRNELYEFTQSIAGGHQHAMGEIIYKVTRFAAKGNEEDVLKVAAWAFLIWKHNQVRP